MRHFAHIAISLVTVIGSAIAGLVLAIMLLNLKRWVFPTGPMTMGDFESPVVAIGGFMVGLAAGLMIATYRLRRSWSTETEATATSIVPLDGPLRPTGGYRLFVAFSTVAIVGLSSLSAYFGLWETTWNWEFPLDANKVVWIIWLSANIAAPLVVVTGISRLTRFRIGGMVIVWSSLLLLVGTVGYFHLPGQYQQIAGGLPNGEPNGSYGLGLIACCVLQWGIVLATAAVISGLAIGRRATTNNIGRNSPLQSPSN